MGEEYKIFLQDTADKIKEKKLYINDIQMFFKADYDKSVGCTIDVMSGIDRIYGDALVDYEKTLATLDEKFGDVRTRRNTFVEGLLKKRRATLTEIEHIEEGRLKFKGLEEKCFKGLTCKSFNDDVDSKIKALKTVADDILHILEVWYLDQDSLNNEIQIRQLNADALLLPSTLQAELTKKIVENKPDEVPQVFPNSNGYVLNPSRLDERLPKESQWTPPTDGSIGFSSLVDDFATF